MEALLILARPILYQWPHSKDTRIKMPPLNYSHTFFKHALMNMLPFSYTTHTKQTAFSWANLVEYSQTTFEALAWGMNKYINYLRCQGNIYIVFECTSKRKGLYIIIMPSSVSLVCRAFSGQRSVLLDIVRCRCSQDDGL